MRDEKVLPLEEAIRKMSSAGAQRFNLRDRGLLHEGYFADVVIFDPETISDKATYADSHQLSVGRSSKGNRGNLSFLNCLSHIVTINYGSCSQT